jgi:hypothetical protein
MIYDQLMINKVLKLKKELLVLLPAKSSKIKIVNH